MKFSQMPYARPEFDQVSEKMKSLLAGFKDAKNAEECFAAYKEIDDFSCHISSMEILAFIRNSLDTTDEYYYALNMEYTHEFFKTLDEHTAFVESDEYGGR